AQGEAPAQAPPAVAPDSIVVLGLRRVDRKQVLDQSGLAPGRPLGYRDVQRAMQALYATGEFDDVRAEQDTAAGRQLLIVRVRERPILVKWAVRGVSRLSEGSVRDKAQLAEGRPLDPAALARGRGRIDSLYRAEGYYLAHVSVIKVYEADSARVRVVFDVDEGRRVAVARVAVEGNTHLGTEQLVAESTGKGGRGVVPVVDDPLPTPSPESQIVSEVSADPLSLGTEFMAWEYATEELCARLGVNAFDQPDVEAAKALARAELAEAQGGGVGAQHAAPLPTITPDALRRAARPGPASWAARRRSGSARATSTPPASCTRAGRTRGSF